jgi:hypothetical protein
VCARFVYSVMKLVTGLLPVRGGRSSNNIDRSERLIDLKVVSRGKRVYRSKSSVDSTLIIGIYSPICLNSLYYA